MTAKARRQRQILVWSIFRFGQRFELPDDARMCRQSPLIFTKDFVGSGQDDESVNFAQQMMTLTGYENHLQLRGAFSVLKNIAANRSRCYRGYLLDERMQPASDKKISQWLGLDITAARKVLKDLAEVGLIEKVPLPRFDLTVNDDPKGRKTGSKKDKNEKLKRKNTKKKTAKPRRKPIKKNELRSIPEQPGTARSPLRAKTEEEDQSLTGIGNNKPEDKKQPGSAAPHPGKADSNESANPKDPKGKPNEKQYQPPELKLHVNQDEANPKDPTGPMESDAPGGQTDGIVGQNQSQMESDAGAGLPKEPVQESSCSPPRSVKSDVTGRIDQLYDPQAREFAATIYRELGVIYPPDSTEAHSELACFASAWSTAQSSGLGPMVLTELWDKAVRDAAELKKKRRRIKFTKSPEAVWRYKFGCRLEDKIKKQIGQKTAI